MTRTRARDAASTSRRKPGARPGATRTGGSAGAAASTVSILALALASGFYAWMLGGPRPLGAEGLRQTPRGCFAGLPVSLAIGAAAGILVGGALSAHDATRRHRGRVAAATFGLYLSGLSAAVGPGALLLAPAVGIGQLAFLVVSKREARADGLLLALHAGCFGAALCFFHQWARYRAGWEPLVENLAALRSLLY